MIYPFSLLAVLFFLTGCSAVDGLSQLGSSTAESNESADVETSQTEDTSAKDAETSEDEDGVNQENVKLAIKDQSTAGQIVVGEVATARDGWVSIHKSNEDGGIALPDSLGQARVDSGDSKDVIVDLWEAPYPKEKLWVLLHIDSGERGTYEFPGADVAVKKNDEMMARSFYIKDDSEEDE